MILSKRLLTVKSLVPHGARLLDIGSDHALLPSSLFLDDTIRSAVVTDLKTGPLSRSRTQLEAACFGAPYSLLISDGFEAVDRDNYDFAAICGMGGELIARIINGGGDKARIPMALQPMTAADKLRAYLWDNGFSIEKEVFTTEDARVYVVMLVKPYPSGGNSRASERLSSCECSHSPYSYSDLYLGQCRPDTEEFALYALKTARAAEKRLIGQRVRGEDTSKIEALIEEALRFSVL